MSLSLDIRKFAKNSKAGLDETVRAVNLGVTRQVIQLTPVGNPALWKSKPPKGYTGGQLKGNWFGSIGSPSMESKKGLTDSNGSATISRAKNAIARSTGEKYYIVNNMPYARRIEYEGWSSQAPTGMARRTVAKFKKLVQLEAQKTNRKPKI